MGMLKLRRNAGEKVIVQSPIGKLEILVDSLTPRAAILGFDGPSDYSIHREESANRAIQNEGAKIAYYPLNLLEETYWEDGEDCYDSTTLLLDILRIRLNQSKPNIKYLYAVIERDLKNFRVIAGRTEIVLVDLTTKVAFTLDCPLTCFSKYFFINSLPFELVNTEVHHFGFRMLHPNAIYGINYYSPRRIDFHA